MANHETKVITDSVHVLMAFQRKKFNTGQGSKCMRQVVKDYKTDLDILTYRCRLARGNWRIHRTVNARDTQKARLWLIHYLIDHPEASSEIDTLWRTALLQPENAYGEKNWMLDIDTKEEKNLRQVEECVFPAGIHRIETHNGWHYITAPFDTRKLDTIPYKDSWITLIKDGYYYIRSVTDGRVDEPCD